MVKEEVEVEGKEVEEKMEVVQVEIWEEENEAENKGLEGCLEEEEEKEVEEETLEDMAYPVEEATRVVVQVEEERERLDFECIECEQSHVDIRSVLRTYHNL